ncbi:hypothetical protein SAY87_004814 [Trapa incisa]|uniref:Uncharacterized protein n=1 Tax=Trapa incisa TaxID=236973 RepID=A0AAN7JPS6_9MYRT|nr:hypothetical protein SAY87_004814 [Trapa incisa]
MVNPSPLDHVRDVNLEDVEEEEKSSKDHVRDVNLKDVEEEEKSSKGQNN